MTRMLLPGEPAPWFRAQTLGGNPSYAFDSAAGRWVVMLFMGSARQDAAQAALRLVQANRNMFDDVHASLFGVTIDREDAESGRIGQSLPGIRWFLDYNRQLSSRFGAITGDDRNQTYAPHWLLLDPMLRVSARANLADGQALLDELRRRAVPMTDMPTAPALILPGVLLPDQCRRLMELHRQHGGIDSGFMREENGVTVPKFDHSFKRRADYLVEDEDFLAELKARMATVLRPMIHRAFQFDATRVERFLVACYDGGDGGQFRAHRDNTTKGTAHRRFACTINLNAEEFEGGDICFPEFGRRTYRAPTGGALVFSCSMLHEAQPVTRGRRYALLPFFYDDDGARLRERNLPFVGPELQGYKSGLPPA
jgi:predicted 2-oxoglutarate/Fe(II)-dependent dioxygenase YbiX/peroxiredoxin